MSQDQPRYGERVPGAQQPQPPASASAPARRGGGSSFGRAFGRWFRPGGSTPIVTWTLAALCIVVYLLELILGNGFTQSLEYYPPFTASEPWTMLTSAFLHSPQSIWHILFNMYTLLVFGPALELWLGRGRYLALYLLSAFAGSVAVLWIAPGSPVLGASGAIFGVLAAFVIVQHGFGANPAQLVIMIGLNLAIGFFTTGISWQAHVGGLAIGALIAWIYLRNRGPRRRRRMIWLVAAVGAGLVVLTILGYAVRVLGTPELRMIAELFG